MHDIHENHPKMTERELYSQVSAGFLKHADHDPEEVLEHFEPTAADAVLYIACEEFCRLCGGGPSELRALGIWGEAMRGLIEPMPGTLAEQLMGITTKPRAEQLDMGKQLVARIRADPTLRETYSTK